MEAKLKLIWEDKTNIGHYECTLYEDDKEIDDIHFIDYTNEWLHASDVKNRFARPTAFEVFWCHGWAMSKGFDYDPDYYDRVDENGLRMGGYQGKSTHTVEDIKKWCEEWLAQRYIKRYEDTIKELDHMKSRCDWFKSRGYGEVNLEEDK